MIIDHNKSMFSNNSGHRGWGRWAPGLVGARRSQWWWRGPGGRASPRWTCFFPCPFGHLELTVVSGWFMWLLLYTRTLSDQTMWTFSIENHRNWSIASFLNEIRMEICWYDHNSLIASGSSYNRQF
jgi:hypothetical protein